MNCPYCENEALFISSKEYYGRDYGTNLYVCRPCDAYVGTYGNSKNPLGTMAKKDLRELRKRTHELIDVYWREGKMTRTEVYKKIQDIMNLSADDAHIGKFNEEQCKTLIAKTKLGIFEQK